MSDKNQTTSFPFTIPKRKADQMYPQQNCNTYTTVENPVLANSYYNCYQQPHWPNYQQQYHNSSNVDPITQNIYNVLSMTKERPKNNQKNVFKETVPDVDDPTLPKELTSMFQPLFCKLCSAQLSSSVMAKVHYKSRNHESKVRRFLIEYSERTGEPLHKRARVSSSPGEESQDPMWFYCEACDLPLTGKMHAESHYMGKNHQKVMLGYKKPAGKGFYNAEGKWVRQTTPKKVLAPGEDTFGLDFRQPRPTVESTPSAVPKAKSPKSPTTAVPTGSQPPLQQHRFFCKICNVSAPSQAQLDMHLNGQKHQKKMRNLDKALDMNLSVYRTPSGDYYCPTCNTTLNSEVQFKVHLKSKGHMKKYTNSSS